MSNKIFKGKISTIDYEERLAKVKISDSNSVTPFLKIPNHIDIDKLKKETSVAYVYFDDGTGAIICELWEG